MERTPEQCCQGYSDSQKAREGDRWDKHLSNSLDDQQMEGQDQSKGGIKRKEPLRKSGLRNRREMMVASRTNPVIQSERNI